MALDIAYMDAGIWVAYGLGGDDKHYDKAKEIVEKVVRGELVAIVSLLSLLETMDVIRKRTVQQISNHTIVSLDQKNDDERKKLIKKISERKYSTLYECILKAAQSGQMVLVDFKDTDVGDILIDSSRVIWEKFGNIPSFYNCSACRKPYRHYDYKGLGPIDVMHILLAKKVGCNYFYTTDHGFEHLLTDPNFASIQIKIIV